MITISKTIKKAVCAVLTAALLVTSVAVPQKVNAAANANDISFNLGLEGGTSIPQRTSRHIIGSFAGNNGNKITSVTMRVCKYSNGSIVQSYTCSPGAVNRIDLRNSPLDNNIKFAQLAEDSYYLQASVTYLKAGTRYTLTGSINFVVLGYKAYVNKLYVYLLGRNPDAGGLNNWVNAFINGNSASAIAREFVLSAEFKAKNYSDSEFVNRLYLGLLDRDRDLGGYNCWMAALQNGASRENVLNEFLRSQEFSSVCARYNVRP